MLTVAIVAVAAARADDELDRRATWSQPLPEQVAGQLKTWLEGQPLDEVTGAKIEALWPAEGAPSDGAELLEQLATTFALLDDRARELVALCRGDEGATEFAFLSNDATPPLVRNNLRLLYGCWLAQHQLYDESLDQLKGLEPQDVVDPAALMFYQSVGYHRLVEKKSCLTTIALLLENEKTIPHRYATVVRLMEADLRPLKEDSLDEIARLMNDIRRRLDLARAGTKVRKEEEDVIAKIDKLIEKIESESDGGRGESSTQGRGSPTPQSPADGPVPTGQRGRGGIDHRKLGDKAGWGNLPPKQREAALQQISKDFPSHYREVIEEYFRKLARDGVER